MKSPVEIRSLESIYCAPTAPGTDRLLIVLHGLGDSYDGFRFLPKLLGIPGLHYLLVNAPDPYFTGYSWFHLDGRMAEGVLRSRAVLFDVLEEVHGAGWEYSSVGILGFSQGCLMALDMACRFPHNLGAVVGISGFVGFLEQYPEAFSPQARNQKILVTHGTADAVLPFEESKQQMHMLLGMGLRLEFRVYEKEHTIDPRQEVEDIRNFLKKNLMKP